MRLEEAGRRFNELAGIRFGDLFSPADMNMIIIIKEKPGSCLSCLLGCIFQALIWILMMVN